MKWKTIGGMVFAAAAVLHLARITIFPELFTYVPLWLSMIIAVGTIYLAVQYLREYASTISYVSAAMLLAAGFTHGYRMLLAKNILLSIPPWFSLVAIPIAGILAWLNLAE